MHQLSHFFRRPGRQGVAVGAALLLMLLAANGLHTQPPLAAAGGAGPDLVLSRPDGAVVGHDLHHDQSAPLRSLPLIAPGPTNRPLVDRDGLPRLILPGPAAPDPVVQRLFHALGPPTMPGPIQNFDGLYNYWGYYPPDTNGDVGPNDYVQIVNVGFQIFNKTGATRYGPANTNTLWQGFGGVCEADNDGDPVVVYDPIADRWNISQFGVPGGTAGYHQCIAVSTSGDPTGSYYRYDFLISQTLFDDYPKLGVWPDAYYASFNMFNGNPFVGPWAVAFDRARMLAGAPASFQYFTLGNQQGTLLPADLDGASLPAAGAPEPFANFGNNTLNFWKFHVDWVTPANSTFTGPTTLATANFNQLCPRTASCVPQPSTAVGLDGLGDRLMFRLAYRNFGGYDTVVLNHSVNVGGGQAGVRWYEVRNPTGTPSLYQQGTYAPDTTSRWMGSIAMDHAGDIAVGYSASSATIYPSIRYTGRLASDPLGTLPQGEATLMAGSGSQTGTANRWGDYSDLTVDPTDDCTFWYTTEYYATTGERNWRTRIGSFKFPGCTAPPPTPTATGTRATATPTYTATPSPLPSATPCAGSQVFTGAITNTDALETGRLTRGTGISTCANVKTCPGAADTIARHYKKYTYTNTSGAAQCVTVS
ncbi:MAG TPA: hypothetical protein VKY74_04545, partial [Chloroflexia bacterium]|nr:hypothetical protein [Chloroflexia bacterium]